MSTEHRIQIAYRKGYRCLPDGTVTSPSGRHLKFQFSVFGYYQFSIRDAGKRYTIQVHKLQAYTKFGEASLSPGVNVRHLNGVRTDNRAENIAVGTASDNALDIPEPQRRLRGFANAAKALTAEQVRELRRLRAAGVSLRTLSEEFGISPSSVSEISRGKRYAHIPL